MATKLVADAKVTVATSYLLVSIDRDNRAQLIHTRLWKTFVKAAEHAVGEILINAQRLQADKKLSLAPLTCPPALPRVIDSAAH
ncbi:hypothetical protein [Paraburkholderia atlantica]|uniref:hypothetical protein n=1 Tax=Paraburkholderia atlantica TaxID=2654982 RepID=UPI0012F8847C|nr:hypothetical protein [Paraburkholderia atlantica]